MTDSNPDSWPNPVHGADPSGLAAKRLEAIINAEVDLEKQRRTAAEAQGKNELDLTQKMQDVLADVAVKSIDRARSGAEFVQTAASAIGAFYTGVLGLIFVSDQPLPVRGLIPTLFLGAAVVLAAYYLAFFGKSVNWDRPPWANIPREDGWVRLDYITIRTRDLAYTRVNALRASVVALAFGLVFLPIGFVPLPSVSAVVGPGQATSSPSPAPAQTAAPVVWPLPTVLSDPKLSAVLYEAQLTEFTKSLSKKPPTDTSDQDQTAVLLAIVGGLIVLGFALGVGRKPPPKPSEGQTPGPAAAPES